MNIDYGTSPDEFADASEHLSHPMWSPRGTPQERFEPPQTSFNDSHITVSPLINIEKDPVGFNFLVQAAIVDAKDFKIFSYDELDQLKKELSVLTSRYNTLKHKIELEGKVGDAAASLARLHGDDPDDDNRKSVMSFMSKRDSKRHSRQAADEHAQSVRKVTQMNSEAMDVHSRIAHLESQVLQHSVAVLAYSQLNPAAAAAASASDPSNVGAQLDALINQLSDDSGAYRSPPLDLESKVTTLSQLCEQLSQQCQNAHAQLSHYGDMLAATIQSKDGDFDKSQYPHFHDMLSYLQGPGGAAIVASGGSRSMGGGVHEASSRGVQAGGSSSHELQLQNLDLKDALREAKFKSSTEIQDLNTELTLATEQVTEYRDKCESLSRELDSVVRSLEDLTVQTVDYESERQRLEGQIEGLNGKLEELNTNKAINRISMMPGAEPGTSQSITALVHQFRTQIRGIRAAHLSELKKEQEEKRRLQGMVRQIKSSSYVRV